ncbi:MAG: hypothetical protein ACREHC_06190 [Candidatus Levyibacteriota bacterium]
MQPIPLVSWEKYWEIRTRWALNCSFILGFIVFTLTLIYERDLATILIVSSLLIVVILLCYVSIWVSKVYVKKTQRIHIFNPKTLTIITKRYKIIPVIFKNELEENDHLANHEDHELKYFTILYIKERGYPLHVPNFFL